MKFNLTNNEPFEVIRTADDKNVDVLNLKTSDLTNDSGFANWPIVQDKRTSAAAAITADAPFATLTDGQRVTLHLKQNMVNSSTLNLTLSGGTTTGVKSMVSSHQDTTLSNVWSTIKANSYIDIVYESSNNRWILIGQRDTNNTYTAMTQAEINAGSATTGRTITPSMLRNNFYTETEIDTLLADKENKKLVVELTLGLTTQTTYTEISTAISEGRIVIVDYVNQVRARFVSQDSNSNTIRFIGLANGGILFEFMVNSSNEWTKTQTTLTLTYDNAPTANSDNPVKSSGIKTYVDNGDKVQSITTYQTSTPVAVNDTHDQAISKLIKIIEDNEYTTAMALDDLENDKANTEDLANVAFSGSYNDLSNKPTFQDVNVSQTAISSAQENTAFPLLLANGATPATGGALYSSKITFKNNGLEGLKIEGSVDDTDHQTNYIYINGDTIFFGHGASGTGSISASSFNGRANGTELVLRSANDALTDGASMLGYYDDDNSIATTVHDVLYDLQSFKNDVGDVLIVTLSYDARAGITSSHTYAQISTAYQAGKNIFGKMDSASTWGQDFDGFKGHMLLGGFTEQGTVFTLSTCVTSSSMSRMVTFYLDSRHDWVYTISDLAKLSSPAFSGTPTAPTAGSTTNNTQIATTAFVQTLVSNNALKYTVKAASSSAVSFTTSSKMLPNTVYVVGSVSSSILSFTAINSLSIANGSLSNDIGINWSSSQASITNNLVVPTYQILFKASSSFSSITLPASVKWKDGLAPDANDMKNNYCELTIMNGIATMNIVIV